MEETGVTIPEYHAAIASFMVPIHASMLEKLSPWHLFTRLLQTVHLWCQESLTRIIFTNSLYAAYKLFLPFLQVHRFSSLFHFHHTLFPGLAARSLHESRKFSICQITHSFFNGFHPNLCQHFSHVCSTCHTIFTLKECI